MPMKITSEMICANCGNKIEVKGKPFRGRRSAGLQFNSVYVVAGPTEYNSDCIEIEKGYCYHYDDDDDAASDIICSKECVVEAVQKMLPKLKVTE